MDIDQQTLTLAAIFVFVGALYACIGHAGASGYLAVMALAGVAPDEMRPTALAVNVAVAAIAFTQFMRAGHFSWGLTWPFLLAAPPAAFLGAAIPLSTRGVSLTVGIALCVSAAKMAWDLRGTARAPKSHPSPPSIGVALPAGASIGVVAGLTGTGGGIFLSPLMLMLRWADPKQVAATSALFILANSIAGLGGLAVEGWIPHGSLLILVAAGAIGGAIGAHVGSRRLASTTLRAIVAVVIFAAGVKLVAL